MRSPAAGCDGLRPRGTGVLRGCTCPARVPATLHWLIPGLRIFRGKACPNCTPATTNYFGTCRAEKLARTYAGTRYRPTPKGDTDPRRKEIQTYAERRYRPRQLRGTDRDGHEVQTKEIFLTLCAWYENLWRVRNTLSVVFLRIFDKFKVETVRDTF